MERTQLMNHQQKSFADRAVEPITPEEALTFYNYSDDMFIITDKAGSLIKASPACERILGLSKQPGVYNFAFDLVHPDDRERAIEDLSQIVRGNDSLLPRPVRCRTADGTYRWVHWRSHLEKDQKLLYTIGRDMTDEVNAVIRAKNLAAIVQNSNDAIISIGLDNRIASWNKGASHLFRYLTDEAEGRCIDELFEKSIAEFLAPYANAGAPLELDCRRQDGSGFVGLVSVSTLLDSRETKAGYSIAVRDISDRKESERRIREFYSMVSHELRTPLTSIRGVLGLLNAEAVQMDSPEAKELVVVAKSSAERLIRLINDILDVQKIESGRIELHMENIDANQVAAAALSEISGMSDEMQVSLKVEFDENLEPVAADKDKTIQILANLLSNAIKFSPAGETVILRTKLCSNTVRFEVEDKGPGIRADQAHKLFEKFQQLDSSDSRKHQGTGLGLAICKSLAENQGGNIGYENQPTGCVFWFELPRGMDMGADGGSLTQF